MVGTNEPVYRVEELALSQAGQSGTHRIACQISRETEILRLTVFHIIPKDLKVTCFKKSSRLERNQQIMTTDLYGKLLERQSNMLWNLSAEIIPRLLYCLR